MEEAVNDQHEMNRQLLHGLDDRHVIVLAPGMKKAVEIITADVPDPFQSAEAQAKAVKWIEGKICESHDFYFVPSFDPADQDERVRQFLGEMSDGGTAVPAADGVRPTEKEPLLETPGRRADRRGTIMDAPKDKKIPFDN